MKKLLIVEDAKSILIMLKIIFEKRGFIVETTDNGNVAVDLINLNDYDCILLDILINGINGIEVLKSITEEKISKVIIASAVLEPYEEILAQYKVGGIIPKPFGIKNILEIVENLVYG